MEISVFNPNKGKYGPEITTSLDIFHAVPIQFLLKFSQPSSVIIHDLFTCSRVSGYIYGTFMVTFLDFIFLFCFLINIQLIVLFFKNTFGKSNCQGTFYTRIVKMCFSVKGTVICTTKYKFLNSFSVISHLQPMITKPFIFKTEYFINSFY